MTVKNLYCPSCGGAITVNKDEPDGYFMGYSVGCRRYSVKNKANHKRKMSFFGFDTAEQATLFIRQYIETYL